MTLTSILYQTFWFPSWNPSTGIPDLTGKTALVTGASTGLGKVTAMELARKGCKVYCLGRSKEKTLAAIAEIKKETGNENVQFLEADLQDLDSVQKASEEFMKDSKDLHILVNNAGIMNCPYALSKQGIESQFGTNHFSHAVLTNNLLPLLKKSQPSRIVNLSSLAHLRAPSDGIHYEDLNNQEKYVPEIRYGETKMANIHFTRELQEKLLAQDKDCKIYVNAVHPGVVKTELTRSMDISSVTKALIGVLLINPFKGALTQLYAAAAPEIESQDLKGRYFVTYCTLAEPNAAGKDSEKAKKTWSWTEEILQKHWKKDWKWNL